MEILGLLLLLVIFGPPVAVAFGVGWFFGSRSARRKLHEQAMTDNLIYENQHMRSQNEKYLGRQQHHQSWDQQYRQQGYGSSSPSFDSQHGSRRDPRSWYQP